MRMALYAGLFISSLTVAAGCQLESRPQATSTALGGVGCLAGTCEAGSGAGVAGLGAGLGATGGGVSVGVSGSSGMVSGGSGGSSPIDAGSPDAMMSLPDAQVDANVPLLEDGNVCSNDDVCASGHCDGTCCSGGDCCRTPADCNISASGVPLACNDVTKCSGSGGTIRCMDFRCQAIGGEPNDSACDSKTIANNCGPYKPVYCNGNVDQQPPVCPVTCATDDDCDPTAHCDGVCVPNVPNGGQCTKDLDCASAHCNHGLCCNNGDCCASTLDCPASYSGAATCDSTMTCQGTRKIATCNNAICGSMMTMDDSACDNNIVANPCGLFADVKCTGGNNQVMMPCRRSCIQASQCDSSAYCDGNSCVARKPDGEVCGTQNDACISKSCGANMLCCLDTGGLCCKTTPDCGGETLVACTNLATCVGTMTTPLCNAGGVCTRSAAMADPSGAGCAGMLHDCGPTYATRNKACPAKCSCMNDNECSNGSECRDNACVQRQGGGDGGGGGNSGNGGPGSNGDAAAGNASSSQ
jgi:hypothetical protein